MQSLAINFLNRREAQMISTRALDLSDVSQLAIFHGRFIGASVERGLRAHAQGRKMAPGEFMTLMNDGVAKAPAIADAIIERGTSIDGGESPIDFANLSLGARISLLGSIIGCTLNRHGVDKLLETLATAVMSGSQMIRGYMAAEQARAN